MHMNPYRDRYIDLLTRILPQTYTHAYTYTQRHTAHAHVLTHTHILPTGHNTQLPSCCPLCFLFLAKKSSCPFALSFSFQVLDSWKGLIARRGDGEGAGGVAGTWREANLFLQLTDGVRTNDTVGIKTPSELNDICKLI